MVLVVVCGSGMRGIGTCITTVVVIGARVGDESELVRELSAGLFAEALCLFGGEAGVVADVDEGEHEGDEEQAHGGEPDAEEEDALCVGINEREAGGEEGDGDEHDDAVGEADAEAALWEAVVDGVVVVVAFCARVRGLFDVVTAGEGEHEGHVRGDEEHDERGEGEDEPRRGDAGEGEGELWGRERGHGRG